MADYLESYAASFGCPCARGSRWSAGKDDDRFVLTAGAEFEAEQGRRRDGRIRSPSPGFARELDPEIGQLHSSDYRNPGSSRPGGVFVVGAEPFGRGHRVRGGSRPPQSCPVATRAGPVRIDTRRAHVLTLLFFAGSTSSPWTRRRPEDAAAVRLGGAPLLRHRKKELRRAGSSGVARSPVCRAASPCSTTGACSTSERGLVHRLPARLLVDRGPVRLGTTATRCSTGAPWPRCRGCTSSGSLPALVHLDADRGDRQRRGARRRASRVAASKPGGPRHVGRAGGDVSGRRPAEPERRPLLVWNGRAARLARKDSESREPGRPSSRARLPPGEPSQRDEGGVSVRDMSRKPSEET